MKSKKTRAKSARKLGTATRCAAEHLESRTMLAVGVPADPSNLSAARAGDFQVNLTWTDRSTTELGFAIERRVAGGAWAQITTVDANFTNYADRTVAAGTIYGYRVRAFGYAGASEYTSEAKTGVGGASVPQSRPAVPSTPTNLRATVVSGSQIELGWTDTASVEYGFAVERSEASGPWVQITTVDANVTQYTSAGLSAGVAYRFRVRAFGPGGASEYTAPVSATPTDAPGGALVLANPNSLRVSAVGPSHVTLTWRDRSEGETGFLIEQRKENRGPWLLEAIIPANTTRFVDRGLSSETTYAYRVRAINGEEQSGPTAVLSATTTAFVPTPSQPVPNDPSALTATAISSSQIRLNWADNSDNETGFKVEREDDGNWTQIAVVGANVTVYVDSALESNTTYAYRVRAYLGGMDSAATDAAADNTFAIPVLVPQNPSNLGATGLSTSQIRLIWTDNATNEAGFKIERRQGGSWTQIAMVGANVTSHTDSGLAEGTTYAYRVRAYLGGVDSGATDEASATTQATVVATPPPSNGALSQLRVASNGRYLVDADGAPFFWLGDTAWELFHRLTRTEMDTYLADRAAKGFNVIQAVAVAELDGFNSPNALGDSPFWNNNVLQPAVTGGSNASSSIEYDYWDHVDYAIQKAKSLGMYVALLPTWGAHVKRGSINGGNAEQYGRFLGERYRNEPIIWVLGGDTQAWGAQDVWRAMARGIAVGVSGAEDYSKVLMTYHAPDGESSSLYFPNDNWLDFNMFQSGHGGRDLANYLMLASDWNKNPAKPTLDAEPRYESSPVGFSVSNGRFDGFDVRQAAYWSVFAGAMGHTYGHHSIWQMWVPGRSSLYSPDQTWVSALSAEGAGDMGWLRALIESRPMLSRVPDQSLVADAYSGADRLQATRGDGYAMIYSPTGRTITVNLGKVSGSTLKGYWFNPRTGQWQSIGTISNSGQRSFTPPTSGRGNDWVLVLDDASRSYSAG